MLPNYWECASTPAAETNNFENTKKLFTIETYIELLHPLKTSKTQRMWELLHPWKNEDSTIETYFEQHQSKLPKHWFHEPKNKNSYEIKYHKHCNHQPIFLFQITFYFFSISSFPANSIANDIKHEIHNQ